MERETKRLDFDAIRKTMDIVRDQRSALDRASNAAQALLWFEKYASTEKPEDVLKVTAGVIASATPGADIVNRYVVAAVKDLLPELLEAAIWHASKDFEDWKR